ncbi:MAG: pentapeptide repeat-containing protein, partial [Cyanophyceae cyanobacterium]
CQGADLRGANRGNAVITGSTSTGAQLDGATLSQGFDQGS